MGRTLIDNRLQNLLSPTAMFNHSSDVYQAVHSPRDSYFILRDDKKVPLRWDGRLWYLDYLGPKTRAPDVDVAPTPSMKRQHAAAFLTH